MRRVLHTLLSRAAILQLAVAVGVGGAGPAGHADPGLSILPQAAHLLVGDTLACSVAGSPVLPLAWDVSDTAVASISSTGLVFARSEGEFTVDVIDAADHRARSAVYKVSSFELELQSVSVSNDATSFTVDVTPARSLSGLGIRAFEMELRFDPDVVAAVGATSEGTSSAGWGAPSWHLEADHIVVAHAGTVALAGQSTLLKFILRPAAGTGDDDRSSLTLTRLLLNEGQPSARPVSGSVTVRGERVVVQSVTVVPALGVAHAGGQLALAAIVASNGSGAVSWSVREGSGHGSVSATGVYEAPLQPPVPAIATVVATSLENSDISGSARITILPAVDAGVLQLSVVPNPARPRSFQVFVVVAAAPDAPPLVQVEGTAVPTAGVNGSATVFVANALVDRSKQQAIVQASATVAGTPAVASTVIAF